MTTLPSSARTIRVPWFKAFALASMTALAGAAAPASLDGLTRAYREAPSQAGRTALERYAAAHAHDANGALARLALGVASFEQRDYAAAAANLHAAEGRLPHLADYVAYYLAAARLEAKDAGTPAGTVSPEDLAPARSPAVPSPLAARAAVIEGRALVAANAGAEAVRVLRGQYSGLPQPEGDLALAKAYEASGDLAQAAASYQRVYYYYPGNDAATKAAAALVTLRDTMGGAFPRPGPELLLARADKLLAARDTGRARDEYRTLVPQLSGTWQELARVRAAAADYLAGNIGAAYRGLRGLSVSAAEADAERLYYVVECARKLGDDDEMIEAVKRLGGRAPHSPWRFKALVTAANRFLVSNQPDRYVPLYQAAYEDFPAEPLAANCHWKVAWHAYLKGQREAGARLREHLERYPDHLTATAALYFMGRLAERDGHWGEARAWYARLAERFPNYYYGTLARGRLEDQRVADATADAATTEFLGRLALPERPRAGSSVPLPATALRTERARLLRTAGLDDFAAAELRFGAGRGEQPVLLAVEMARIGDSPSRKLQLMKTMRIDYFAMPVEEAPAAFWQALFPLPYRNELMRNAKSQNLDPFTVAALIRQESEFNPQAVSSAKAYGLTQVTPGTGRQLARRLGVRRFRNNMLFQPATNLKLGTYYMRSLLDQWGGRWEETLAAYNAGPRRAAEWAGWRTYREPAEFIESIPYTETRGYVQAVLRNAAMYRRLYPAGALDAAGAATAGKRGAKKAGQARSAAGRKTRRAGRS